MAVNKVDYISAGKPKLGGAIFTAPLGTALPADSATALAAEYVCIGYASDEGLTNNIDRSTTDIKAWGGDTVLVIQDDFSDKFSFALLQTADGDVLKAVFGEDNVTVADGKYTIRVNSSEVPEQVFVFDMVLRNGGTKRLVVPKGKLTMSGDISYSDDEAVMYSVEIKCMPDSSGQTHYEYTAPEIS